MFSPSAGTPTPPLNDDDDFQDAVDLAPEPSSDGNGEAAPGVDPPSIAPSLRAESIPHPLTEIAMDEDDGRPVAPLQSVSEGTEDKYFRVTRFLQEEAAYSPHVLKPLLAILLWCCSLDPENKAIIGNAFSRVSS